LAVAAIGLVSQPSAKRHHKTFTESLALRLQILHGFAERRVGLPILRSIAIRRREAMFPALSRHSS